MSKVIGFCNQKGGTGKTTSILNIATFVALADKKVLIIDMDPQANATSGLGINHEKISANSYDILLNNIVPHKAILNTNIKHLYIIPATPGLAGAEIELVDTNKREYKLLENIDQIRGNFDYIFIDSPPSLGLLTLNIFTASDSIIIPIQCEYYALEGLSRLLETIRLIKESLNPGLEIEGIILTMADFRTRLTLQVIEEVRKFFPEKVYKTIIPRNVKLSEAPSFGKPVYMYDNSCLGAKAYFNLTQEILGEEIKGVYDGKESVGQGTRGTDSEAGEQRGISGANQSRAHNRIHLY